MTKVLTSSLADWSQYAARAWPTLLLGNGLSMNIWSGFGYSRLLDEATLTAASKALFREMATPNFEAVLEAVMHAEMVLEALGQGTGKVKKVYADTRNALFEAVRKVHVPHAGVPSGTLHIIGGVLDACENVFTTNYDLLPYWSLMETPGVSIVDFFWGQRHTFDSSDTDLLPGRTGLYFLHGGIHLWQSDRSGLTGKWTNSGSSLLRLRTQYGGTQYRRPLFVSEATSRLKLRTIRRSDYLTFALDSLRLDESDTVVFGHSLSAQDDHVVEALNHGARKTIAVGLRPASRRKLLAVKGSIVDRLARHNVVFFDSTTHPLGDSSITLPFP